MSELYLTGKIKGQKLIDGKIHMQFRCGIYDYYFKPKSLKQQIFLMDLYKNKKDIYLRGKMQNKENNTIALQKIKVLSEYDKNISKLIKSSRTKKTKRVTEESRLQLKSRGDQVGSDSKHRNAITKHLY